MLSLVASGVVLGLESCEKVVLGQNTRPKSLRPREWFPTGNPRYLDPVHATASPGAGRGRGVQREMTGLVAAEEPPVPFGLRATRGCCAWAATETDA